MRRRMAVAVDVVDAREGVARIEGDLEGGEGQVQPRGRLALRLEVSRRFSAVNLSVSTSTAWGTS